MNKQFFSFFFLSFCILFSCGDGKKTATQTSNSDTSEQEEPDIELAKFDKIIAEKREEAVVELESFPQEKPKKDAEVVAASPEKKAKPKNNTPQKKKKRKKKYAKIEFDSIVHRLPSITEGDKFKDEFRFTNTGEIPLTITFATASCGCTLPSYPFLDIAPGDSDAIKVEYNSVNKDGPQEAEITVSANTYPKEMILKMVFDVHPKEEAKIDSIGQE